MLVPAHYALDGGSVYESLRPVQVSRDLADVAVIARARKQVDPQGSQRRCPRDRSYTMHGHGVIVVAQVLDRERSRKQRRIKRYLSVDRHRMVLIVHVVGEGHLLEAVSIAVRELSLRQLLRCHQAQNGSDTGIFQS